MVQTHGSQGARVAEQKKFSLTYNSSLMRVRASFTCAEMRSYDEIPQDLYVRMHNKMRSEVKKGKCKQYSTYLPRIEKIHQVIKSDTNGIYPDSYTIHMTLAAGIPDIPGLTFTATAENGSRIGTLKVNLKIQEIQKFHPKTFILTVQKMILDAGKRVRACEAQLMSVYFKTVAGKENASYILHSTPKLPGGYNPENTPFLILPESDSQELKVLIYDPAKFRKSGVLASLFRELEHKASQLSGGLNIWKNLIKTEISLSLHGIELFGILTPLTLLAATSTPQPAEQNQESVATRKNTGPVTSEKQKPKVTPPVPANYPGKGLLQLDFSGDQLLARISGFNLLHYENSEYMLDESWLKNELNRLSVRTDKASINRVNDSLVRKRDLNGIIVAKGLAPTSDSDPAIIPISEVADEKEAETTKSEENENEHETMDLRSMKESFTMVKKGQLIARLIYRSPGKDGYNVFGEVLNRPPPDDSAASKGEGVNSENNVDFYAALDGVMKIRGLEISVIHAFHHKGDVNLSSGNISFSGPVFIEGNVDSGAYVYSSDSIHITGQVRGGKIFCKKDFKAEKGIITNLNNRLYCGGNLSTNFIENSLIDCANDILVEKAIISSEVNCGGNITVISMKGVCGGSDICVWGNLLTNDLGFSKGKITKVILGGDWKSEKSLDISRKRLLHFSKTSKKTKSELQEISLKNKRQMSRKAVETKTKLQKMNSRLKKIVKHLEQKVAALEKQTSHNKDSYIKVAGIAYTNCHIIMKDKEFSIPSQLESIAIVSTSQKDQHIISLDKFSDRSESGKSRKAG